MITRIVELQIQAHQIDVAKQLLKEVAPKVRSMPGCSRLEIMFGIHKKARVTTYSYWDSEKDLNDYRDSEVFQKFWKSIKPMFSEKARAWSSEHFIVLD